MVITNIYKNNFGKGLEAIKLGSDVLPTASIRSDDSCKTFERSNSVFSLVGLEILQLQPLKISHFHDAVLRRTHGSLFQVTGDSAAFSFVHLCGKYVNSDK